MTEQPPQPQHRYAWGEWMLGFILTSIVCAASNFIAGVAALAVKSAPLAMFITAAPSLLFVGLAYKQRRTALGQGVILAASVLALIGGICGGSLHGVRFAG